MEAKFKFCTELLWNCFLFGFFFLVMFKRMRFEIRIILKSLLADVAIVNFITNVLQLDVFRKITFLCICSIRTEWTFERYPKKKR